MALDLKKKMAFAGKDPSNGGKPGKKGPPPPKKNKGNDEDDHDDNSGHDEDDEDMQEGGEGKFGALIPLLEEHASDIMSCCDELDPDALSDLGSELPEDEHGALMDAFNGLDGKLKKAMKSALPGIKSAQADKLASHLHDEGMIDDPDKFSALLERLGEVLA